MKYEEWDEEDEQDEEPPIGYTAGSGEPAGGYEYVCPRCGRVLMFAERVLECRAVLFCYKCRAELHLIAPATRREIGFTSVFPPAPEEEPPEERESACAAFSGAPRRARKRRDRGTYCP